MVKTGCSPGAVVAGLIVFFATAYRVAPKNFAHSSGVDTRGMGVSRFCSSRGLIKKVLGDFFDIDVVVGVLDGSVVE